MLVHLGDGKYVEHTEVAYVGKTISNFFGEKALDGAEIVLKSGHLIRFVHYSPEAVVNAIDRARCQS